MSIGDFMEKEDLIKYRDSLTETKKDRETDFHTIITYIAAGALGLFVTINEKFINLSSSTHKYLLLISISSLILTFALTLIINLLNAHFAQYLISEVDRLLENTEFKNADSILEKKWTPKESTLKKLTILIVI